MTRKKASQQPPSGETEMIKLEIVLKCDVAGTVEAVKSSLASIHIPGVEISIIQSGVGNITKSDVLMAQTGSRLVIGFNVKRFDYHVLGGYTDFNFNAINTLDILEDVYNYLGFRISLAHLAQITLDAKKTADGLQALQWWKEGRMDKIVAYCRQDVRLTRDLFLFGQKNGYLLFKNKADEIARIPVDW